MPPTELAHATNRFHFDIAAPLERATTLRSYRKSSPTKLPNPTEEGRAHFCSGIETASLRDSLDRLSDSNGMASV